MVKLFIIILFSYGIYAEGIEIPIIISSKSQINLKILSGLRYSIKSNVKILNLDEDKKEIERISKIDNEVPIISIGSQATYFIRNLTKRKVIFSNTNFSREGIQYEKGKICGYFSEIQFSKYYKILKEINPNIKNITIFYSSSSQNYYTIDSNTQDYMNGMIVKIHKIDENENFNKELEAIGNRTDAFFLVADPLYTQENFEKLSIFCKYNKILLFSHISSLTDMGIGFSLDADLFETGIQTGNLINNVLNKSQPCEMGPFFFPDKEILRFNQGYLKESGYEIPVELKERTELEEINSTGVELYLNGKKGTALNIFQYVLTKSPSNESASKYSKLIINEKYDNQVKGALLEADRLFDVKKYIEAKSQYEKILKINPNISGVKEKIEDCNFQFSEQKRLDANIQMLSSNPFSAIQTFNESLKFYPQNIQSRQGLNSLRSKLSEKIPSMLEEGMILYNHRKYNESIPIFRNILLVEEGNKKAKEYLRLSIDKKEAIDKLMNCKKDKDNPCSL